MSRSVHRRDRRQPRGAATVELAVLLPLLGFILVAAVDYARIAYYSGVLSGCARNGALHGRRSPYDPASPYLSLSDAALADATDLRPAPAITSTTGADPSGDPFVEVSASYQFKTFAKYPGIPNAVNLVRTVRMSKAPSSPRIR